MNPSINQSINHTLAQSIHIHQSFSAPHCVTTLSDQTQSNRIKHQVNASRHHSNQCIKRSIHQSIKQSRNQAITTLDVSVCVIKHSLSRNRIERQVNPSRHVSQSIHIHQSFSARWLLPLPLRFHIISLSMNQLIHCFVQPCWRQDERRSDCLCSFHFFTKDSGIVGHAPFGAHVHTSKSFTFCGKITCVAPTCGLNAMVIPVITLTTILSQTCYSRARPARGTRGPHKVCDNLH